MNFRNYQGLFQEWEVRHARELIKQFQRQFKVLEQDSLDDLLQDCLTHWYFNRDQFDPSKLIKCKTYMGRVVENKLRDILKGKERNVRKSLSNSIPIETLLIDEDDDLSGCLSALDKGIEDLINLEGDDLIARAMEKLSRRQKELCR